MFETRSTKPERIDTGDYTPEEYERFLREIAFINKYFGDRRALRKTLFRELEVKWQKPQRHGGLNADTAFSILDVGCGSGDLLRFTAEFARRNGRKAMLVGIDMNEISASMTRTESAGFSEINVVRGDAFRLPFADGAFDYAISSLFFHHLADEQIPHVLKEMSRVSKRGIFVIDLHRHPAAYVLYKLFCLAFRISPLVRHDGSLSIRKGFTSAELVNLNDQRFCSAISVWPFRIVLSASINATTGSPD